MAKKKGKDEDERIGFETKLGLEVMGIRRKYGLYDLHEYESKKNGRPPCRHYVAFFLAGRRKDCIETKEVASRDPMGVRIPEKCYAFMFFDGAEDGRGKEPKNVSGKYYPDGMEMSFPDALECFTPEGAEKFLLKRKEYGFDSVVEDRLGGIHPFYKQDRLLLVLL